MACSVSLRSHTCAESRASHHRYQALPRVLGKRRSSPVTLSPCHTVASPVGDRKWQIGEPRLRSEGTNPMPRERMTLLRRCKGRLGNASDGPPSRLMLSTPLLWAALGVLGSSVSACGSIGAPDTASEPGSGAGKGKPGAGSRDDDPPTSSPSGSDPDDPVSPNVKPGDPSSDDDPSSPSNPSPSLGNESGPGALPDDADPGGVDVACEVSEPGVSPLMKLSTVQYRNTVRDLLDAAGVGDVAIEVDSPLQAIPDDSLGDAFRGLDNRISLEHVQGYLDVGTAVGDAVAASSDRLQALVGDCALDSPLTDECAGDFLSRFLRLAYRRPVGDSEIDEYIDLNDSALTPAQNVRNMLVVALSSPRFVNHVEIDGTVSPDAADVLQLTSYEIASRLSYTFWQTMPDAELLKAADEGALATAEGFEEQLERVFDDPRTRQTLWQFWNEWLKLEKFTGFETSRPAFKALAEGTAIGESGHDYYGDMVQEVRDLTNLFTFDRTANLAELMTTDISVTASQDLAELYGVDPYDGGTYPTLPEGTRGGLFQRAALLVSNLEQTNPFHRGALIRRALLCDVLPQPDPNSLPPGSLDPPPQDDAQTTRERFEAKVEGNGLCEGCHGTFSDIGYVLESFDALGRHRTTERVYDQQTGEFLAELDLNTSAVARVDTDDDTPVADALDLMQRMVDSKKVESCMAQNYFRFVQRRESESGTGDECVVRDLASVLDDPDEGLAGAFARIAQYDGFFQRKVGPR